MSAVVPSLAQRVHIHEQMDDLSIGDEQLWQALHELRAVNFFLGGYRCLRSRLAPLLESRRGESLTILDLGSGLADYPDKMVRWGAERNVDLRVTAVDASPAAVKCARSYLDDRLPARLRGRIEVRQDDATALSYEDGAFDVVTASLFLHHFDDRGCVALLEEMARIASKGIIVNDLHRHVLAYLGIRVIAALLPVSRMFANDGPLSVRRAFLPEELTALAEAAGLSGATVKWHWAFRLTLSTL